MTLEDAGPFFQQDLIILYSFLKTMCNEADIPCNWVGLTSWNKSLFDYVSVVLQ